MRIRKRNRIRNWILRRAVLGFAVAALGVPAAAQARVDESVNGLQNTAATEEIAPRSGPYGLSREMLRNAIESVRLSDATENPRGAPSKVLTPQLVSSSGFDWGDAGIGAGVALGLVMLGGTAFRVSRHLGKPQTA